MSGGDTLHLSLYQQYQIANNYIILDENNDKKKIHRAAIVKTNLPKQRSLFWFGLAKNLSGSLFMFAKWKFFNLQLPNELNAYLKMIYYHSLMMHTMLILLDQMQVTLLTRAKVMMDVWGFLVVIVHLMVSVSAVKVYSKFYQIFLFIFIYHS